MSFESQVRGSMRPGHYDVTLKGTGMGWEAVDDRVWVDLDVKQTPMEGNVEGVHTRLIMVLELWQVRDLLNQWADKGVVTAVNRRLGLNRPAPPQPNAQTKE